MNNTNTPPAEIRELLDDLENGDGCLEEREDRIGAELFKRLPATTRVAIEKVTECLPNKHWRTHDCRYLAILWFRNGSETVVEWASNYRETLELRAASYALVEQWKREEKGGAA
jgi:hypothetical protein